MKFHLITIVGLTLVSLLTSCQEPKDRSQEITEISKMQACLDSIDLVLETPMVVNIKNATSIMKSDLEKLEENFSGALDKELARKMSKYKETAKTYKRLGLDKLHEDLNQNKKQLEDLKALIESKATHDKEGNEITEEYIDAAVQLELQYAQGFVDRMSDIHDRQDFFYE